jgi:cell division septum initiation protein DivIVA
MGYAQRASIGDREAEVLRVALERQSIEKNDFPIGDNGYEPAAVDAHLAGLADELDEFKRATRRRSETLASSASEQVRAIVQAAETSAADIQRAAEEEASEIKADADREADLIRQQAGDEARMSFGKVSESTTVMLQRLDSMEGELTALIESLRAGSDRLNADLQVIEGNVGVVGASLERRPPFQAEPAVAPQSAHEQDYEPPTYDGPSDDGVEAPAGEHTYEQAYEPPTETHEPAEESYGPPPVQGQDSYGQAPEQSVDTGWGEPSPAGVDGGDATHGETDEADTGYDVEPGDQPAADHSGQADSEPGAPALDDTEGARLIALNMALNGTPRDETARYLGENFQLPDRDGLLDEVYASVED